MGMYLNPGNNGFKRILKGYYVDKTGMIELINNRIDSMSNLICVSRPRRFGKSYAARMKQEFTVEKPQLVQTDGKNYVKIVAKQPSGKRAVCNVDLHGKIAYKFDNYAGMTCLKDIEKFNVDLEKVYSVKLSDERVLWQNPDRLSMDANRLPANEGRKA